MFNCSIHTLYSTKKQIGKGKASYRLCKISDVYGDEYLFCVSYKGRICRCALCTDSRAEAKRRFLTLVKCSVTPLSLRDTVRDAFE